MTITVTCWKQYTTSLVARAFYLTLPYEDRTEAQWKHAERLAKECIAGESFIQRNWFLEKGSVVKDGTTYLGEACKLDGDRLLGILCALSDFGQMLAGLLEGKGYEYYQKADADNVQLKLAAAILYKIS